MNQGDRTSSPLQGTVELQERSRVRALASEVALPTTIIGVLSVVGISLVMGVVSMTEGVALFFLLACVGGGLLAAWSIARDRPLEAPAQHDAHLHPGWYRYGPVGGVGAFIGLAGLLATVFLRAPEFVPLAIVLVALGTAFAVPLYYFRQRNSRQHRRPAQQRDAADEAREG